MHKNYKNGFITGNTIRFAGYNQKTNKSFIVIDEKKIKINKLNNSSFKCSGKKYKDYDDYE